jgi:hypothetical protein
MQEFNKIKASRNSLSTRRLVFGVGKNDAWYMVNSKINNKMLRCPIYTKWKDMIKRAYSKKYQSDKPSYKGVTVCKEWLSFSCFSVWYENNYIDGYQLDKDIIKPGNKVYSPDFCLFVPCYINTLLINCAATRGRFKQGVSRTRNGTFKSAVRVDCEWVGLGHFKSESDAYLAYKLAKNSEILRKCEMHPEFKPHLIKHLLV